MRSTSSIIAPVLLASAFCFPAAAHAGTEMANSASSSCGTPPREAIAAAEKALADKQPESKTRAIACLLAAVKVLDAERLDIVIGKDKQRFLNVPRSP